MIAVRHLSGIICLHRQLLKRTLIISTTSLFRNSSFGIKSQPTAFPFLDFPNTCTISVLVISLFKSDGSSSFWGITGSDNMDFLKSSSKSAD